MYFLLLKSIENTPKLEVKVWNLIELGHFPIKFQNIVSKYA